MPISQNRPVNDQLLAKTSLQLVYSQDEFIASKILTPITHHQTSGYIGVYEGDHHLRIEEDLAGGGVAYAQATTVERGKLPFIIKTHGLHDFVYEDDYLNVVDPFKPELDVTVSLSHKLLLRKEFSMASILTTAANFNGGTNSATLSGTSQYNDYDNSTPIIDFSTARQAIKTSCGRRPDTAVMSDDVFDILKYHPDVIDKFKFVLDATGGASIAQLAEFMGVKRLLVSSVVYNSAKENQPSVLENVFSKDIIFLVSPQVASSNIVTFGFQPTLQSRSLETRVLKSRVNNPPNTTMITADTSFVNLIVNAGKAGYLIKDAVA